MSGTLTACAPMASGIVIVANTSNARFRCWRNASFLPCVHSATSAGRSRPMNITGSAVSTSTTLYAMP